MKDRTGAQDNTLKNKLEVSRNTELKAVVDRKDKYKRQNRKGNLAKTGKDKAAEDKRGQYKRKVCSNDSDNIGQGKEKLKSNPGGYEHGK